MPHPESLVDVLGAPYSAERIVLPPDDEGEVVATLVSRASDTPSRKAVLHVHGFCDYFFQTGAAEFWVSRGYDFYALDMRKYGRSLLPHQTPNYITDLADYYPELDEAHRRITERDGHDQVVVSGHSTGGLVACLWVHDRALRVSGLVLNAPWLAMHGSFLVRAVGTPMLERIGGRWPRRPVRRSVTGLYGRSLHRDYAGEWDFDLSWKPLESWPVFAGWVRAIRRGHAAVHRGLRINAPALVLTSDRSLRPRVWDPSVHTADIVLDVDQIARWSPNISSHLTLVRVPGAMHDVTLSREPARSRVFEELGRWLDAHVDR